MLKRIFAVVTWMAVPVLAWSGAEGENPFRKAKVGDYVAYKMSVQVMGKEIQSEIRQEVSAKDDKSVALKVTVKTMGKEFPAPAMNIDLTKPFDPLKMAIQAAKGAKFEKTGDGEETVEIGDKSYKCKWIAGKVGDKSEVKIWTSAGVPLGGVVKMETKAAFGTMTMQMTESGRGK